VARCIALLGLAAAVLSVPAGATTTTGTHADPSGAASDPVFALTFGGPFGPVAGPVPVNVLQTVTLQGSYSEDDANGSPHAPLQLFSGVSFDDWDLVFLPTTYTAVAHAAGVTFYTSGAGSFAYYVAGSAHAADDLIYSASFSSSVLTVPASGVGALDSIFGTVVELTYGPASGLAGLMLLDPEQFGFSFANYTGNQGTNPLGDLGATATASFTSSALVIPEPSTLLLVTTALLAPACRRWRRASESDLPQCRIEDR
jgi:hypothetical protein